LGSGFGLAASTPESAGNTPMPIMFLPFLGSGVVPTATMPAGVRQFAEYQPFTPMPQTLRGLLTGTPIGDNAVSAIAWCLGFALIGYLWSRSLFHRNAAGDPRQPETAIPKPRPRITRQSALTAAAATIATWEGKNRRSASWKQTLRATLRNQRLPGGRRTVPPLWVAACF
jgi:hypothetical protein